jgi:hypothetical protein
MITSTRNLKEEIFKLFWGDALNATTLDIDGENFFLQYAKKSSTDYTEASLERYPCISVEDFTPTPRGGWNDFVQKRYVASDTDGDGINDEVRLIPLAIWIEYRVEVSIAVRTERQHSAAVDYFYRFFSWGVSASMLINRYELNGLTYGDPITYTASMEGSPRGDGILESVVSLTFRAPLDIQVSPSMPLITQVQSILNPPTSVTGNTAQGVAPVTLLGISTNLP